VFDQVAFLGRYPEFVATLAIAGNDQAAVNCFNEACVYLDNTDSSRVPDPPRSTLLNMLTAHILALYFGVNGKQPSRAVGRVSSGAEGSINVSLEMGASSSQKAWYEQTMYGASYWRASMGFRSALYVPPVCSQVGYLGRIN
jgi:hypothetical protein